MLRNGGHNPFSPEVLHALWPWLDRVSKGALRLSCKECCRAADFLVQSLECDAAASSPAADVIPSSATGVAAWQLRAAAIRWPGTRTLSLSGWQEAHFQIPAALVNITSLHLTHAKTLVDIASLRSCLRLRCLVLTGCSALEALPPLPPSLTTIDASWCRSLSDIASLAHCPALSSLDLVSCPALHSVHPLYSCTALQYLNVRSCTSLRSLEPLQGCAATLSTLDLSWCTALTSLGLSSAPALRSLHAAGCSHLADLSFLCTSSQLETLDITSCSALTTLAPLSHCSRLSCLTAAGCTALQDVTALREGPAASLTELCLRGCCLLRDLEPLACCVSLRQLDVSWCTTASLPCLAGLSQLQSLDASRCCALRDISGLSRCGQLLSLDLTWCWSISSLEPLVGCSRLVRLQLRGVPPDVDLQPLLTLGSDALVVSLA